MNCFSFLGRLLSSLLAIAFFSGYLCEEVVPCPENSEQNNDLLRRTFWNFLFERSLLETSKVRLLPHTVPAEFAGGKDKSSLFKSCFRALRSLLKSQWREYNSQRRYEFPELIPGMIRVGEKLSIAPPATDLEKKDTFGSIHIFCEEAIHEFFRLEADHEEFIEKCKSMNVSPPVIKKIPRSKLPIDVRARGENMLAQMEELDQKKREIIKSEMEHLEMVKKGDTVPLHTTTPIHELLRRYQLGKDFVEASQVIENPSFYGNWMSNDSKTINKIVAADLLNRNPVFNSVFGITQDEQIPQDPTSRENQTNPEGPPHKDLRKIQFMYSGYALPGTKHLSRSSNSSNAPAESESGDLNFNRRTQLPNETKPISEDNQNQEIDLVEGQDPLLAPSTNSYPGTLIPPLPQSSSPHPLPPPPPPPLPPSSSPHPLPPPSSPHPLPPPPPPPPPLPPSSSPHPLQPPPLPQTPTHLIPPSSSPHTLPPPPPPPLPQPPHLLPPSSSPLPQSPPLTIRTKPLLRASTSLKRLPPEFFQLRAPSPLKEKGSFPAPEKKVSPEGGNIGALKSLDLRQDEEVLAVEDIPLLAMKELGLADSQVAEIYTENDRVPRGPVKYYNQLGMASILSEAPFGLDLNKHGTVKKRRDLESKIKNPDYLVPFKEVYVLPENFDPNFKKPHTTENELIPRGFDRFGLIELPSRERVIKGLRQKLLNVGANQAAPPGTRLSPLNVEAPINKNVYYINAAGIRRVIPDYDLNPRPKKNLEREKKRFYQDDQASKDILKSYIKMINQKKRKRLPRRFGNLSKDNLGMKMGISKAASGSSFRPKARPALTVPTEFAPLSSFKGEITSEKVQSKQERIGFSDVSTKAYSVKETSARFYTPGNADAEDVVEESYSPKEGKVRFILPKSEEKPKKKYVSPPPPSPDSYSEYYDDTQYEDEDEDEDGE